MAGKTVSWAFPKALHSQVRERVFVGRDGNREMRSEDLPANQWCIWVNWIAGVPHYGGWPGTPCPNENLGVLTPNVWNTQVGGDHYTKMKIQPFEFTMANNLDPMQHTIIKYVCRFRGKNGIQDLEKARQTIDLLIQWEKDHATAK